MWFDSMLYINSNCLEIILKLSNMWFGNKLNVFNIKWKLKRYFYRKFKIIMMMVNFH